MIALIDTILNPVLNWILSLKMYLEQASVTASYSLEFGHILAPITALSPAWSMFVSNCMVMISIYIILFIIHNGKDGFISFIQAIKLW